MATLDGSDVAEDTQRMTAELVAARVASSAQEREERLCAILAALKALTVRDVEPDQPLFDALFEMLVAAWRGSFNDQATLSTYSLVSGLLALPEFQVASITVNDTLMDLCFEQLSQPGLDDGSKPFGSGAKSVPAQLPGGVSMVSGSKPPAQAIHQPVATGGSAPSGGRAEAAGENFRLSLSTARAVLDWIYRYQPSARMALRPRIGRTLLQMAGGSGGVGGPPPPGTRLLLHFVAHITSGFGAANASHRGLLLSVLLPLHRPSGRLDETTPHLSLYHEALVHNLVLIIAPQPQLLPPFLNGLLQIWPLPQEGNSAKEILLLHELEQLLELASPADHAPISSALAPLLGRSISSDNSRLAERALSLFASAPVRVILFADRSTALPLLMSALVRSFTPHWNQTVNRMTCEVLSLARESDSGAFSEVAEDLFGPPKTRSGDPFAVFAPEGDTAPAVAGDHAGLTAQAADRPAHTQRPTAAPPPGFTPMRAPWAARGAGGRGVALGLGVGGGAPAMLPARSAIGRPASRFGPHSRMPRDLAPRDHTPPPLPAGGSVEASSSEGAPKAFELKLDRIDKAAHAAMEEEAPVPMSDASATQSSPNGADVVLTSASIPAWTTPASSGPPPTSPSPGPGLSRVLSFMEKLRPPECEGGPGGSAPSTSAREHLTDAPTMLPNVIFQDLVFGNELGSGSFSTVRYCKRVIRGVAASAWPEYAAKVISRQLMTELGYEAAVRREIAILRQLKHVAIARLVASFRWRSDVYLLLEYASRGDLHSTIRRVGSLATPNARFITAEVCVGLRHVHSSGYAFGDLKPENILLTASGHVKLTDFGAARPLPGNDVARLAIIQAKNVIQELRDGDWTARKAGKCDDGDETTPAKMSTGKVASEDEMGRGNRTKDMLVEERATSDEAMEEEEDHRLEGTVAYLSPELVHGAPPSVASDCWALGCVLYQSLSGKPPLWAATQAETLRSIVRFSTLDAHAHNDTFPVTASDEARSIVHSLLTVDTSQRLGSGAGGITDVLSHTFFDGLGDAELLYSQQPPPLAQGPIAPVPNAAWARRQNSMMWSPLPQRYVFDSGIVGGTTLSPIEETDIEASVPFVAGLRTLHETGRSMRMPPP